MTPILATQVLWALRAAVALLAAAPAAAIILTAHADRVRHWLLRPALRFVAALTVSLALGTALAAIGDAHGHNVGAHDDVELRRSESMAALQSWLDTHHGGPGPDPETDSEP